MHEQHRILTMREDWLPFGRYGSVLNVVVCSSAALLSLIAGLGGEPEALKGLWLLLPLDVIFIGVLVVVRRRLG